MKYQYSKIYKDYSLDLFTYFDLEVQFSSQEEILDAEIKGIKLKKNTIVRTLDMPLVELLKLVAEDIYQLSLEDT